MSKHYGCLFHFCQAIYHQVQYLGKKQQYSTSESFRVLCKKFMALALMPHEHALTSFKEIQADASQLSGWYMEELLIYLENNWLNTVDLWNVTSCDHRTNNVCEVESCRCRIYSILLFFLKAIIPE